MAKATTLTATLPDGQTVTRKTARSYTHLIAYRAPEGGAWFAGGWCGSLALAMKSSGRYWKGYEEQIILVN